MSDTPNTPAWMQQLPDPLKTNESLAKFNSLGDLGNEFIAMQGKLTGSVRIPGDNSTPEERETFYKAYGRPDKADGYTLPEFKELPEGMILNKEMEAGFREMLYKHGANNKLASELYDWYGKNVIDNFKNAVKAQAEAREKAKNDATQQLKTEWGQNYEKNLEIAKRAYKAFGNDELTNYLDKTGIGNEPLLLKAFHGIALKVADDTIINGSVSGGKEVIKDFVYDKSPDLYPKQ